MEHSSILPESDYHSIILYRSAYHPRIKGIIKKLLESSGVDHTVLGNGSSFTGFSLIKPVPDCVKQAISKFKTFEDIKIN